MILVFVWGSLDDDFVFVDSVLSAKGFLGDDFVFVDSVRWVMILVFVLGFFGWWFCFCWFGSLGEGFFGWWFWFLCGGSLDDDFVLVDSVLRWWFLFLWIRFFGDFFCMFGSLGDFFTLYYKVRRFISLDLSYQIVWSRCIFGSIFHALQLFLRFFRMICFWKYVKYVNFGSGYEKSYKNKVFLL